MNNQTFKDNHYSKLHSLNWRNYQIWKLPPLELAFFEFIWHKQEYYWNGKKEGKFYWTIDSAIKQFRSGRAQLERLSEYFVKRGIIIKTTDKIRKGSQVTKVHSYCLNFHSLTNPKILSTIVNDDFLTEMQSEFSYLGNMVGYFNKPVGEVVEPVQEVKDFYTTQWRLHVGEKYENAYYAFADYILRANNPYKRPLTEISSLPGQPTYEEFVAIVKAANKRYVDIYKVLGKYIDKPPKTKSFTVSFSKWVESERKHKSDWYEDWSLNLDDKINSMADANSGAPF